MSVALDVFLFASGWTHVLLAPYTKVEESFNLHATHDVLMYGITSKERQYYDHQIFPGAVPRTFIGSVLLAWLTSPILYLVGTRQDNLNGTKFDIQILVRLVLASVNALGLCLLRRAVSRRFGRPTSLLFTLLTCSQFHIPFWMGRTLPNMFAFLPVNISSYLLLDRAPNATKPSNKSLNSVIALLTFTAVVFRSEVLLLLAPLILQILLLRYKTITSVIKVCLISGLASIALTVFVDSYFWTKWIWPEAYTLYFNIYLGKSSDWGVSPFHAYITSHLPKLLLSSFPLAILGIILDSRIRSLLIPPSVFIALISCLGHKEWRFVIYVIPLFNIAAARGARWMVSRPKGTLLGRLLFLALSGLLLSNCFVTYTLTRASIANYPGGVALSRFNQLYENRTNIHVHISNLAAQTGASLFLHEHAPPHHDLLPTRPTSDLSWTYNKTEGLSPRALTASREISHLIAESLYGLDKSWDVVDSVKGFGGWRLNLDAVRTNGIGGMWDILRMEKEDKVWILERKGWQDRHLL